MRRLLREIALSFPADRSVVVYFRDLERHLIELIRRADLVVGCVAWLTSPALLWALASVKQGVSIIVQKEDFLRPDYGAKAGWEAQLRAAYGALPEPPNRYQWPGVVSNLSVCCDPTIDPVRCLGNHNRDRRPAFPRLHHKFLVFLDTRVRDKDDHGEPGPWIEMFPRAVWTGSF